MKRTAKEGVKRGKHRAAHQKVAPERVRNDTNSLTGQKPSKLSRPTSDTLDNEHDVKKVANGRLPPLVPPVKISRQKNNDIELREHQCKGKRKRAVESEEAGLRSLSVDKDKTPPRASSPATRRRNENMTSYERMLQRERRKSRKTSTGSYAILQSEHEEEHESVDEQDLAVEDETNPSRSNTSLQSRPRSGTPSRQDPNQALLQYFAKLSSSADVDDSLDLEHIQSLLHEGASVNTSDRFGQTLLHEVARSWGVDVAQFFIDQGKHTNN